MHIINTISSTENLSSGITHCVNELSFGLGKLGQHVEILSLGSSGMSGSRKKNQHVFKNDFSNIPLLHKVGLSSAMKRYIMTSNANILHTHGLWMFPNCYRNPDISFIISPHGMLAEGALKFSSKKKKIFDFLFQRSAFSNAKLLFATAESELEDIRNYGLKTPVALISNGVNIPIIKKKVDPKKIKTVISLGRIHPKKGLDILIKAWSRVEPIFNNWQLKIVGPNELGHQKELEALIKKLNLKRVHIEPPIYGSDKDMLLSKCNLFVLPSKSENFALTVAESLAVKVPVIATKDTPWSGLGVYKCGWWVEGREDSLVEVLKIALNLPEKQLVDMGNRGKIWMQKDFSWEHICEKTMQSYTWLIKNSEKP
ncbi:glycosyltransferase, partial [Alphaproteobacteria bacterium]|nr:glycosyltransferase [Alphaproteobacteria bacterium]